MFCMWTTGTAVPPFFTQNWCLSDWLDQTGKGCQSSGKRCPWVTWSILIMDKCWLMPRCPVTFFHEVLFPPDRHSWTEPTTAALKTASVYRPEAAAETHRNTSLLVLWPKCRHMHKHRVQTLFITKHTCTPETECGTSGRADWLLPLVSRKKNKHR